MARHPIPTDLPDEVLAVIGPHLEPDPDMLAAIEIAMVGKRDEAKKARTESGIELAWLAAEEAYVGIDDANRHEFNANRWVKPWNPDGPLTRESPPPGPPTQSTVYVRLTARYVDAGTAKLCEILLPPDDKAFTITETPVPELIQAKDDQSQVVLDHLPGSPPAMRAAEPHENPTGQQPPVAMAAPTPGGAVLPGVGPVSPAVPLTVGDLAKEKIQKAGDKAKRAEKRIFDWLVECRYTAEARKAIFDSARLGVGVVKGPIAKAKRKVVVQGEGDAIEVQIADGISPVAKWCDPWNVFPAPGCGEVIRDGDHCFERDWLSERQVRKLARQPGYIKSRLQLVLTEGPQKANNNTNDSPTKTNATQKKDQYEVWYFYGSITRADMACICLAAGKPLTRQEAPGEDVYAIVTLINDRVVRATINPLDSGELPYYNFPWQRRAGHWAGIGIGEQITGPQRMVNAATRAMLNNAGKSAGSQIVVDRSCVEPADGSWAIVPDKIWNKRSDDNNFSVEQAFALFQIPNMTEPMMVIIQYAMRLAEETTSIPLITQGQSGPTQPDTFGAAQLQNNNANQLLRSIGYNFDDFVTEPMVQQFYEWLLLDPDVPADEKGDFNINAHGSAALIERAIQDQMLVQMLAVSKDPAYGLDPRATMDEFLKSRRFNPTSFKRPKEEQDKIDAQPPPKAPQVEVAEIRAQTEDKKLAVEKELEEGALTIDAIRARDEAAGRAQELENEVAKLKTELAKVTMQLETQKQLAGLKAETAQPETTRTGRVKAIRSQRRPVTPQVAPAAIEPPGRADPGRAFQA